MNSTGNFNQIHTTQSLFFVYLLISIYLNENVLLYIPFPLVYQFEINRWAVKIQIIHWNCVCVSCQIGTHNLNEIKPSFLRFLQFSISIPAVNGNLLTNETLCVNVDVCVFLFFELFETCETIIYTTLDEREEKDISKLRRNGCGGDTKSHHQ